jgi:hypothetical protein
VPVGPDDLVSAAAFMERTLDARLDWTVPAGTLEWSCIETLHHIASCMLTYATHLASRAERGLPPVRLEPTDLLTPPRLLRLTTASVHVLAETARAGPPTARAYHPAGMADPEGFCAMGCDEVLVHTHDIALGLGLVGDPSGDLAGRILHRLFPLAQPGPDPWHALLHANGRGMNHKDWTWQAAPHG